jgi:hypothetical protein
VEGFFSALTRRRLKRGVFCSLVDLQAAINRYVAEHNKHPKPFTWTAEPDRVLAAIAHGKQMLESLHQPVMDASLPHYSPEDLATWLHVAADWIGVAHDVGYSQDHSTILVGADHMVAGARRPGLIHIERLPLGTAPALVRERTAEVARQFTVPRTTPVIIVDARSNPSHFQSLVVEAALPVVSFSMTAAEAHALRPVPQLVPIPGRRPVPAHAWTLSRNAMFSEVEAALDARDLRMARVGDFDALRAELRDLQRVTSDAGRIHYEPPPGGHDDLVVTLAALVWAWRHLPRPRRVVTPRITPLPARAWG